MPDFDYSKLPYSRHEMPSFVRDALNESGLMDAYRSRPAYQQNDYVAWINYGARQRTKERRLNQMLDELRRGDVYMKIEYTPSSHR